MGTCPGIENYSRHIDGRKPGEPPNTLINFFPDDFLMVIDESQNPHLLELGGIGRFEMTEKQLPKIACPVENEPLPQASGPRQTPMI